MAATLSFPEEGGEGKEEEREAFSASSPFLFPKKGEKKKRGNPVHFFPDDSRVKGRRKATGGRKKALPLLLRWSAGEEGEEIR